MPDGLHMLDAVTKPINLTNGKKIAWNKRKVAFAVLGGIVAKTALFGAAYWYTTAGRYVSTDNAYVGAATAQVNAQVSGGVAELKVDDTQMVRRGDVLAVIDPVDARLAVARTTADYKRTLQRVQQYYAQVANAAAQVRVRQAELARADEQYDRRRGLTLTGAVSEEELVSVREAYNAAQANLASAREALAAQQALTDGYTIDTHPETLAARAALDAAVLDLSRTTIQAPIDGIVAQRKIQVGQRVSPGQALMTITPLAEAYVDANFKESQLRDVRIGMPVKITSDLYGDEVVYHGKVAGMGGGTGAAFAVIPAQNATGNWIKVVQRLPVRIALNAGEVAAKPLRVGLSMNATIDTRND